MSWLEPNNEEVNNRLKSIYEFRSIHKCSLFKWLCTLTRLCEENILQPLQLEFILHPHSALQIVMFKVITKKWGGTSSPTSSLRSPIRTPPCNQPPPPTHTHTPIITCQGKRYVTPCRSIPRRRAPLKYIPKDLISIDLVSVVFVFFSLHSNPSLVPVRGQSYPWIPTHTDGRRSLAPTGLRGGRGCHCESLLLFYLFLRPDGGGGGRREQWQQRRKWSRTYSRPASDRTII